MTKCANRFSNSKTGPLKSQARWNGWIVTTPGLSMLYLQSLNWLMVNFGSSRIQLGDWRNWPTLGMISCNSTVETVNMSRMPNKMLLWRSLSGPCQSFFWYDTYYTFVIYSLHRLYCKVSVILFCTTATKIFKDAFLQHVTHISPCTIITCVVGWEGGDEWIRLQFRIYLQSLMATVKYGGTVHLL